MVKNLYSWPIVVKNMQNFSKKIKKSPRYIAGGLKRIFVVIDHKMCYIYIIL